MGSDAIGVNSDSLSPLVGSSPATAAGILKSRACLTYVVETLDLPAAWDKPKEEAIQDLKGDTSTSIDDNGLLVITANSDTPERCVQIIEAMYAYLRLKSEELTLNVGKENREYLADRVTVLEGWADAAEKLYIEVASGTDITNPTELSKIHLELQNQYSQAKGQELALESKLSDLNSLLTTRLNDTTDLAGQLEALKTVDPDAQSTMGQAVANLARLLQDRKVAFEDTKKIYTPESKEYINALDRLQTTEAEARKLVADARKNLAAGTLPGVAELKNNLVGMRVANNELKETVDMYKDMLGDTPRSVALLDRARASYQAALARLETAKSQLERARLLEQNDPARFEVLDPAVPVQQAVAPRKAFMSGIWFIFASGCVGWWILRSRVKFVE